MQKKLLAMSLLLLVGAGCTSTATVDTTADTNTETPTTDAATGTVPVENPDGTPIDVVVDLGSEVVVDGDAVADLDVDGVTFTVTGNNFAFAPSTMTVKKGDTVTITFKNSDGFHDLVIDELSGATTSRIKGGEEETITFVADKAGTFEYYCSVGEHRAMGMVGTLTVTE